MDVSPLMVALDGWEACLRKVTETRAAMERGHYYTPLRQAYEAACLDRDALSARIELLSSSDFNV